MSADFSLNARVLSSDAKHIAVKGINAYEHTVDQPDVAIAVQEHDALIAAYKQAGIEVERVATPEGMQDAIFTANWALTWDGKALLSRLPNARQPEEPLAERTLQDLGFETQRAGVLFSGQGDALMIDGKRVIIGNGYRTNPTVAKEIKEYLGLDVTVVRAKPKRHWYGTPVRNKVTGLWDSYFYDIDIAVAIINPELIAVCFAALTLEGREAVQMLEGVEIIPVDYYEARDALACNLVSTGKTVVMSDAAPMLAEELARRDLELITLPNHEIKKGGGGFRCSSLSLYS